MSPRLGAEYVAAISYAEAAAAEHRARMTLRSWVSTADRVGGPDPFKPTREVDVVAGQVSATPSEAIAVLRADADALATLRATEAKKRAHTEREESIRASRAAAAQARAARRRPPQPHTGAKGSSTAPPSRRNRGPRGEGRSRTRPRRDDPDVWQRPRHRCQTSAPTRLGAVSSTALLRAGGPEGVGVTPIAAPEKDRRG